MRWLSKGKCLSLSLVTRTHKVARENQLLGVVTDLQNVCSTTHVSTQACAPHIHMHTQTNVCTHTTYTHTSYAQACAYTHTHTQINVKKIEQKKKSNEKNVPFPKED